MWELEFLIEFYLPWHLIPRVEKFLLGVDKAKQSWKASSLEFFFFLNLALTLYYLDA